MTLLLATAASAAAAPRYVDISNASPAPPYTIWLTAATNIQAVIDVATTGDEIVVTNGTYSTGRVAVFVTMTNRDAVTNAVVVRSVNSPEVTIIEGYQMPDTTNGAAAIRCVYLASGATLSGLTLTNGATLDSDSEDEINKQTGGGVWCQSASATVTNFVLSENSAHIGGGAYSSALSLCTLDGNQASYRGLFLVDAAGAVTSMMPVVLGQHPDLVARENSGDFVVTVNASDVHSGADGICGRMRVTP